MGNPIFKCSECNDNFLTICRACNGTGFGSPWLFVFSRRCATCNGAGQVPCKACADAPGSGARPAPTPVAAPPPSSRPPTAPTQLDLRAAVERALRAHVAMVGTQQPWTRAILADVVDATSNGPLLTAITEKLRLSLADGERHSTTLTAGAVLFNVSTNRGDTSVFTREHERIGGYLSYLMNFYNSPMALSARARGADTLVHLLLHGDPGSGRVWVHVGIFGLLAPGFPPPPLRSALFPTDLLTSSDRLELGRSFASA